MSNTEPSHLFRLETDLLADDLGQLIQNLLVAQQDSLDVLELPVDLPSPFFYLPGSDKESSLVLDQKSYSLFKIDLDAVGSSLHGTPQA